MIFDGRRLNDLRPHQITSLGIGRTFQNIRLWNELSVLDNLRIAHYSQMNYGCLLYTSTFDDEGDPIKCAVIVQIQDSEVSFYESVCP